MNEPAPTNMPSRSMLMFNILYSMIPLIGFWIVEEKYGLEAGIIAAIVLGVAEVVWIYIKEHRLEPFAFWSAILVVVMGGISWWLESSTIIRLKPAILEGVFAAVFLVSSLLGKPFMVIMAEKQFGNFIQNPLQMRYLNGLNVRIGILFVLHTAVTVYAAIWLSLSAWVFVKGILFYVFFAIFFVFEFLYSRFFMSRESQKILHQQVFLEYQRQMIQNLRKPQEIEIEKIPDKDTKNRQNSIKFLK